jgi:SEC-C motif
VVECNLAKVDVEGSNPFSRSIVSRSADLLHTTWGVRLKSAREMGRKPFPRSERCPCGSGDKYKRCCFQKGFTYQVDDETGEVIRAVPLNREARTELDNALAVQREKFIAKFGREPGPDDPIFFDLDEDKLREDTANAMRAAGIAPALIYAYEETGLIVTQENRNLIPDVELREFDAKVREYHDLHLGDDPKVG